MSAIMSECRLLLFCVNSPSRCRVAITQGFTGSSGPKQIRRKASHSSLLFSAAMDLCTLKAKKNHTPHSHRQVRITNFWTTLLFNRATVTGNRHISGWAFPSPSSKWLLSVVVHTRCLAASVSLVIQYKQNYTEPIKNKIVTSYFYFVLTVVLLIIFWL